MSFNHQKMPMYTNDHANYWKQMHEWHMKMHHYHDRDQLRNYHLERAKHFQGLMDGTTSHNTPRPD